MLDNMRRIHPRNAANRGVCVDAEGAMLGPDCILVRRIATGYRELEREEAATVQRAVFDDGLGPDWLFEQSKRIAQALSSGQIALAQIYGLYIPINGLDDRQLRRLGAIAKAGFNPNEPRVPKGDHGGGQWTTGGDGASANPTRDSVNLPPAREASVSTDGTPPGDAPPGGGEDTTPPFDFRMVSPDDPAERPSAGNPEAASTSGTSGASPTDNAAPEPETASEHSGTDARSQGSAESGSAVTDNRPPIEWTINIPDEKPATTKQINRLLRPIATWLGRAAAILGAAYALDPEVDMALAAIEAATWIAEYLPKILSYLDQPKTLRELQNAVVDPRYGYEIHHIVEAQRDSDDPRRNSLRFADRVDSRENLVRVPYWKHVEISSWYSRPNRDFGYMPPREYLRGKSWEEQYAIGLRALRLFGVLK